MEFIDFLVSALGAMLKTRLDRIHVGDLEVFFSFLAKPDADLFNLVQLCPL